jgi:adenylate cyclase
LRLIPDIRYGTELFPEKVARRLRSLNMTTWIIAAVTEIYSVAQFIDPAPGVWKGGITNAVGGLAFAAVPLLHRFGELAAPIGATAIAYTMIWIDCSIFGIGTGMQMYYLVAAALGVLFVGTERIALDRSLAWLLPC